ncbi:MAG: hypothetical protein Q9202_001573 [Teloschistes flavicans]
MFRLITVLAALPLLSCVHSKATVRTQAGKLTLPWGTYVSEPYNDDGGIDIFKNVRFGKAPIGDLRFARSEFPDAIEDKTQIQNSSFGPSCIQANVKADTPSPPPGGAEDEDCLFLDIYAPVDALSGDWEDKLPVVVSIFGGAYIFGGKETVIKTEEQKWSLYDGQGIFDATLGGVIWVVPNYRLGAYGWLAGDTVEHHGSPNAALYDQRLVFQFVQAYIEQVNGDKDSVSAWGNSAGAGSIIHHLTAFQGNQAPLFSRAVLWSPAYQWAWDRKGALEKTYQSFAIAAGCGNRLGDLQCLRTVDDAKLKAANQEVVDNAVALGLFPFGPAVDGSWIKSLPAEQLHLGQTSNLSSLIVSHVWNEAGIFVRPWVKTPTAFTEFLNLVFPGKKLQSIRESIEDRYPSAGPPFSGDQQARLRKVLQDSTFVCNTRQLYQAYKGKTYVLQYNLPPAIHGSDLLASTWHQGVDVADLIHSYMKDLPAVIAGIIETVIVPFAIKYQHYFAGHALYGDPNALIRPKWATWEVAKDDGTTIDNALKASLLSTGGEDPFFSTGPDLESTSTNCDFWTKVAGEINSLSKVADKSKDDSDGSGGPFGLRIQEPGNLDIVEL